VTDEGGQTGILFPSIRIIRHHNIKQSGRWAMFSAPEATYLKGQRLARIAMVSPGLQPDVVPVSFELDGEHFYVGGLNLAATLKHKNVKQGSAKVTLVVVDELERSPPGNRAASRSTAWRTPSRAKGASPLESTYGSSPR
jgi:PPOX class F420-dependent enzyme/OxyR family protein